jgi:hypothetical protein
VPPLAGLGVKLGGQQRALRSDGRLRSGLPDFSDDKAAEDGWEHASEGLDEVQKEISDAAGSRRGRPPQS